MTPKARNILIGFGIVAVAGIAIVGYGGYQIYSTFANFGFEREVPEELKEARVAKGNGLFTRTEFFKMERKDLLGTIKESSAQSEDKDQEKISNAHIARSFYNFTDIRVMGSEVIAAGEFGAFVLDLNGNLKREIFFEPLMDTIKVGTVEQTSYRSNIGTLRIVRLDPSRIGFLSFDYVQGVRVLNENGDQIWSHGKEVIDFSGPFTNSEEQEAEDEKSTHVLEAAVGDLDGDGVSEYIVAKKNDGIRAYDRSGTERWFQPDKLPSARLEVVDLNGDGKGEVIEIGMRVRDSNGKVLREMKGLSDTAAFVIAKGNDGSGHLQFAGISGDELVFSGEDGADIFTVPAPLSSVSKPPQKVEVPGDTHVEERESVAYPQGILVTLNKNEPRYLAVVAAFPGLPRANLYVYDMSGELVYHELLPEEAETVTVMPAGDGIDHILVGGKDSIWRYSVN
jgi:hypothetical protein